MQVSRDYNRSTAGEAAAAGVDIFEIRRAIKDESRIPLLRGQHACSDVSLQSPLFSTVPLQEPLFSRSYLSLSYGSMKETQHTTSHAS